jgi:hypothetical protein
MTDGGTKPSAAMPEREERGRGAMSRAENGLSLKTTVASHAENKTRGYERKS